MKKLFLLIVFFSLILTTSCNQKEQIEENTKKVDKYEGKSGKVTCILDKNTQDFDFKGTYNITYDDGYVTEVYTREVININSEEALNSYYEGIKNEYTKYDDLENYEYSITKSEGKVINNTFIDYKKLDLEKFSSISGQKMEKENLKTSQILAYYKILGAKCEE